MNTKYKVKRTNGRFRDLAVGDVFLRRPALHPVAYMKVQGCDPVNDVCRAVSLSTGELERVHAQATVAYYPDATLHMGEGK